MLADNEEGVSNLLLVHAFNGFLSSLRLLIVDVTIFLKFTVFALLYGSRNNLTVGGEQIFKSLIISAFGETLNEKVGELLVVVLGISVRAFFMENNLYSLTLEIFTAKSLESLLGLGLFSILDVAEATTGAIGEYFQFARFDLTELFKHLKHFVLGDLLGKITDDNVCFLIELVRITLLV